MVSDAQPQRFLSGLLLSLVAQNSPPPRCFHPCAGAPLMFTVGGRIRPGGKEKEQQNTAPPRNSSSVIVSCLFGNIPTTACVEVARWFLEECGPRGCSCSCGCSDDHGKREEESGKESARVVF